ncbi:hypothetical protein Tco_0559380 [Tanacetum coccineum]
MREPTMEEYMTKTREDYGSGIARPKFEKDDRFELKGHFLKELRENTFSGSEDEDENKHIERVLKIVDLFTTPDVIQDQLMLHVFPISLTGATSRWEIKIVNERVYAAQVGYDLCNGPHYTKDCLLKEEGNTLEEAYYTKFGVPYPQAGRYRGAAPGFYQRDNGNPLYQERRKTMEESLSKDDKMPLIELSHATIPFLGRLKEYGYDEKEVMKELEKLQVNSTESATSLRILLKEKWGSRRKSKQK